VELAFAQPAELKIKDGQGKWLLREIVKELIGEGLALAPKRPLQTPQREWIAHNLFSLFNQKVISFSDLNFIKKNEVLENWNSYLAGKQENSFYIWQWVNSLNFTN
ncbi:MAG: asparagine synthase-related protein, partial [Ginsengibacter sp.]